MYIINYVINFKQLQNYSSCSQKQNQWIKGGLKCSYIIPKSDHTNTTKETVKNKLVCIL